MSVETKAKQVPVLGALSRSASHRLEGWCWSPARPADRLVVEITVNDRTISAVVAASLSVELRDTGIGDGFHAFSVPFPALPPNARYTVIEAREKSTLLIFGRLVVGKRTASGIEESRLSSLEGEVTELHAALGEWERRPRAASTASHFGDLGHLLTHRSRHPTGPVSEGFVGLEIAVQKLAAARQFDLPLFRRPRLSVVVGAGQAFGETYASIQALGPQLECAEAELIISDDGSVPSHALLCQKIGNLGYLRRHKSEGASSCINAAAAMARGQRIVFASSLNAVSSLISDGSPALSGELVLGPAASALAEEVGEGFAFTALRSSLDNDGLIACVDRDLFLACGALDEVGSFGHDLDLIDLALKAESLGADIRTLHSSSSPFKAKVTPSASQLSCFQMRWGMFDLRSTPNHTIDAT